MAVGSNVIATAAIGLVPTIQGLRGNIASELVSSKVMSQADSAGRGLGARLGDGLTRGLKTTAKIGGVLAGLATAVGGVGLNSAAQLESANISFTTMLGSAEKAKTFVGDLSAFAAKTPFDLPGLNTAAQSLMSAGVETEKILPIMTSLGDVTSGMGTGSEGIQRATVALQQMNAAQRITAEDLNQLRDAGIPVYDLLASATGKTKAEIVDMASKGKLGKQELDALMGALESGKGLERFSGLMEAQSQSLSGLKSTFIDTFQMGAARAIEPLIPLVKDGLRGAIAVLPAVFEGARRGAEWLADGIRGVVDGVKAVMAGGGGTDFAAALGLNPNGKAAQFFQQVIDLAGGVADAFKNADYSSFGKFFDSLAGVNLSGTSAAISGVGGALGRIAEASPTLLAGGIEFLADALGFMADHMNVIGPMIPVIVAGLVAWRIQTSLAAGAQAKALLITQRMMPVTLMNNIARIAAARAEQSLALATTGSTAATNVNAASTTRATLAERLRTVATKAGTIASKAAALAVRGLGIALKIATGPIGWIIGGITLLAGGLYLFFTKTETGKAIWESVWTAIQNAAAAVVDWFMTTALPVLQGVWNGIAAGALWLYNSAILPAWNGISYAVSSTIAWVTTNAVPMLQTAWQWISAGALWLYNSVILPVWTGIRVAIAVVVTAVLLYVDMIVWYWQNVLAPVAMWLYSSVILPAWSAIQNAIGSVVTWMMTVAWPALQAAWNFVAGAAIWLWQSVLVPAWNGIMAAISAVVSWFQNTAWPILNTVIGWVATAFNWLKLGLSATWGFIRDYVIAPVVSWFQNVAWPILNAVIGWIWTAFENFKRGLGIIWAFVRDSIINPVVAWFRDTAWPVISGVIDNIKRGFDIMRSAIGDAWSWVKDRAISPVANWFRDTIKPLFDTATGGISSAFDTLKTAVEKAWNGIRDTAKVPVEFVVNKIINDAIIGNYNSVAKTFGIDEIARVGLPSGWARGGILPGFRPIHQGDDVLTPMRSGEGVLVSEGLRDRESRSAFLGANAAAKRGMSFAQYLRGMAGYAGGGIVEIKKIAQDLGLRLTSSYRPGARTAQTGSPSLHSMGKAWDFAGPANKMMEFFNTVDARFSGLTELLYSPAGARNIHRGGKRYPNTGKTLANHFNHVHVGILGELGEGTGGGGGGFSLNPFEGLWDSLKDKVREGVGDSKFGDLLFDLPKKLIDAGISKVSGFLGDVADSAMGVGSDVVGGARWTPVATQALAHEGIYNPLTFASLMRRMEQESDFNPRAINLTDSNAKRGTPSKGLMQVIQPTFNRYRAKDLPNDIWDPMANIVASIRYATARYGDPRKGWDRKGGYAQGGIIPSLFDQGGRLDPGVHVVANKTRRPETILPAAESRVLTDLARGQGGAGAGVVINGDIHGYSADEVADNIEKKRRKREALYARAA